MNRYNSTGLLLKREQLSQKALGGVSIGPKEMKAYSAISELSMDADFSKYLQGAIHSCVKEHKLSKMTIGIAAKTWNLILNLLEITPNIKASFKVSKIEKDQDAKNDEYESQKIDIYVFDNVPVIAVKGLWNIMLKNQALEQKNITEISQLANRDRLGQEEIDSLKSKIRKLLADVIEIDKNVGGFGKVQRESQSR